jgi:hypothetical protein
MWALVIIAVVLVLAGAATFFLSRAPKFEVSPEGLRISGSPFGRMIPAAQLRIDAARLVDFTKSPDLRPKWRTMGVGLPGYQAGWFRLHDGEKALVFLSGKRPAMYDPTDAGYCLLISPDDPAALLSSLRAIAH